LECNIVQADSSTPVGELRIVFLSDTEPMKEIREWFLLVIIDTNL